MTHYIGYSEKERELINAWKKLIEKGFREGLDTKVAIQLTIADGTVRSRKSRLRAKYELALDFCKEYRSDQQYFYQKTGGKFNPLSRSGRGKK